jgi:DNA-binding beta-propeller fold protein YncE
MQGRTFIIVSALVAAALVPAAPGARAADLIVSANDAKYQRVAGKDTFPEGAGPDTLTVLDAARFPPAVVATVEVEHSIMGPPQAVAVTPDGRLAVVSAPNRYNHAEKKVVLDTFLQVVDLEAQPPQVVARVELGSHPQGLAINREGTLLLATTVAGELAILSIEGKTLRPADKLKLSDKRLAGVSFTHDGKAALVALRDEQGLAVVEVEGTKVALGRERVSTGVAPYAVDVSGDGRWAVVGNAGLGGLTGTAGKLVGDADTVTLIDVSRRPFRAVRHVTVPSIPEAVAISPDGRWVAVQVMDGSNLTPDNPGRHDRGRVLLFAVRDDGGIEPAGDLPGGEAAQGLVFAGDGRHIVAQFNVEHQLAFYAVEDGRLVDTGTRIPVPGGPASIRSTPR